jgi:hypothetical protein
MPILPKTPTVKAFTEAWTRKFAETVREAAGKDGRLSRTEAARIAEKAGGASLFSDNAVNYLEATGQKTVSAEKLIEAGRVYAERAATSAAGTDGLVSYVDATKLPKDLQADFLYLRGKGPIDVVERTPEQLRADVTDSVLRALDAGTLVKLSGPPAVVRGRSPVVENIPHDVSATRATAFVADGQIYISRASQTPSPLVGWYKVGPLPEAGTGRAELRAAVDAATDGLDYMSETDAHVKFVSAEGLGTRAVTPEAIVELLGPTHDTLLETIYMPPRAGLDPLAGRNGISSSDGAAFLDRMANNFDPNDPISVANGAKWKQLGDVLKANLTDLKLVRYGDIVISSFVVGRTKNGDLAGVFTGGVET